MPKASVYFPKRLLKALDLLASERGVSRDRLITEACRDALHKRWQWPEDFFENSRYASEDLEEFKGSSRDFDKQLGASRQSREAPPF